MEVYAHNTTAALESRAAGIESILSGPVTDVDDLDFVREVFNRVRDQGATGSLVIHPSHVAIANDVFSPGADEIGEAIRILTGMAEGIAAGRAAVRVDGRMVDYAHVRSSSDLLELAEEAGTPVPDCPRVDVTALSVTASAGGAQVRRYRRSREFTLVRLAGPAHHHNMSMAWQRFWTRPLAWIGTPR